MGRTVGPCHYSRQSRGPGRASGIVQSGLFIGAVIGSLGFGWTVSVHGFGVAWTVLAVLAAVAAAIPAYLSARVAREVRGTEP
ncbi:hypothetical protein [Chelativorans alearense]|uniref:hypothetical protein n=1 Tax=Chelativorans alearense TaxID=2681495 RepID=UPI0013D6F1DC|nr:hypothetical protein [Chelativorans alearense]